MITVTFYYRSQCPDCDQALADLQSLQELIPHQLVMMDVDKNPAQAEKMGPHLPVLQIGPYTIRPPFTRQDLQIMLSAARDRVDQMVKVDQAGYEKRLAKGRSLNSSDRVSLGIAKHYLLAFNLFLFFYTGLPFLAPVLMKAGQTLPANIIYKIYSPMCHQLAFRSWFLFGEQAYYPRALAGIPNVITYETLSSSKEVDIIAARNFTGTPVTGYKVALCERDVAIYGVMFLFGLLFALTGRRIRSVPWYAWLVIGVVPIGMDGVSQLPSLMSGMPGWLLLRESTPLLRTVTGALFGLMTAWYVFPMIEESTREARRIVERKMAVIQQVDGSGQ